MSTVHSTTTPPVSLGLTSVVLGAIALALFILPILAMPISTGGIVVALCAIARSRFANATEGGLAIVGLCVCCLAFAVGFAIDYAPMDSPLGRSDTRMWRAAEKASFVPPPLRPFHPGTLAPVRVP